MVKCPRCGTESEGTDKKWKYHVFDVKSFRCPGCKRNFMAYYMKGAFSHTIPKSKRTATSS